jgi:hypothetical protein
MPMPPASTDMATPISIDSFNLPGGGSCTLANLCAACLPPCLAISPPDYLPCADEQMQECAVDLLTKVAAAAGGAHPGWCEECALPRVLKLALHRDYNIRVVRGWRCCGAMLCCAMPWSCWFGMRCHA